MTIAAMAFVSNVTIPDDTIFQLAEIAEKHQRLHLVVGLQDCLCERKEMMT